MCVVIHYFISSLSLSTDNQLSSVQRQLNLYGFKCINRGEDKGAFYHPQFKRGDWETVKKISRHVKKPDDDDKDKDNAAPAHQKEPLPPAPTDQASVSSNNKDTGSKIKVKSPKSSPLSTAATTVGTTATETAPNPETMIFQSAVTDFHSYGVAPDYYTGYDQGYAPVSNPSDYWPDPYLAILPTVDYSFFPTTSSSTAGVSKSLQPSTSILSFTKNPDDIVMLDIDACCDFDDINCSMFYDDIIMDEVMMKEMSTTVTTSVTPDISNVMTSVAPPRSSTSNKPQMCDACVNTDLTQSNMSNFFELYRVCHPLM